VTALTPILANVTAPSANFASVIDPSLIVPLPPEEGFIIIIYMKYIIFF
jgi:hypothetical protein